MMFAATTASANPRALPFTYPSESLAKGSMEIEQYVDITPVKNLSSQGTKVWTAAYTLTTEYEYGITNKLELGMYLQFSSNPGLYPGTGASAPISFDGVKQRLRYRFAPPGKWPVDVAVYGEVAELKDEVELEFKLNFQRRVGPVAFLANLWVEHEFYYSGVDEWVLNPTAGLTWQINPHIHLGAEGWMHAEYGQTIKDPATQFNANPHFFVGPAALVQWSRFWFNAGFYVRPDGLNDALPIGALYGHYWVRTMLGLDFL